MNRPEANRLFGALEATWPAANVRNYGPWRVRDGAGGGKRVSAATADGPVARTDISMAEAEMENLGQRPLFMLRGRNADLDGMLDDHGYAELAPTTVYLAKTKDLTADMKIASAIPAWPPLALQREIWAAGGIDAARVAIMERVCDRKTSILGRTADTPGGTAFVAADGDIAMVHAIEVLEAERRQGIGQRLLNAAANWADSEGVEWIALAVTRENVPANALYQKLGMDAAAEYHYRIAPEVA